ncbi:MAG TPA: hypothetical protein VFV38_45260 [Ktedonobacteraceae bacterium]|nr:hypothetical protein [Ktedonobacteraceae bacterium]
MRTTTPLLQHSQTSGIQVVSRNGCIYVSVSRGTFILRRALAILPAVLPVGVHLVLVVHNEIGLERPLPLLEEAKRLLPVPALSVSGSDLWYGLRAFHNGHTTFRKLLCCLSGITIHSSISMERL